LKWEVARPIGAGTHSGLGGRQRLVQQTPYAADTAIRTVTYDALLLDLIKKPRDKPRQWRLLK
jgi:hypothetical protein